MLKKILALCLCLTLCLSAFGAALADFPQQPETELEGGTQTWRVMPEAGCLQKRVDGGYLLCDMQGNVLNNTVYYMFMDDAKYIKATLAEGDYGLEGILSPAGTELMPVEFDYVSIEGDWAYGALYGDGTEDDHDIRVHFFNSSDVMYKTFDTVCIYNLLTGECVEVIENRNFGRLFGESGYANLAYRDGTLVAYDPSGAKMDVQLSSIYSKTHMNIKDKWQTIRDDETGLRMLADADGHPVSEAKFNYISLTMANDYGCHYFEIKDADDRVGLLNEAGEVVVPMAYKNVIRVGNADYTIGDVFAAVTDDTFSLIRGGVAADFPMVGFTRYDITFTGESALVKTEDKKNLLLLPDGTTKELPENLSSTSTVTVFDGKAYIATYEKDGESRGILMNGQGEVIFTGSDKDSRISLSNDGHVVVMNKNTTSIYSLK